MQKKKVLKLSSVVVFFLLFVIITLLVKLIDVSPCGESLAEVGFSKINNRFFELVGHNEIWHKVSSVLLVIALLMDVIIVVFAVLDLIKKKSLRSMDKDYFLIFGLYLLTIACYILFELMIVNYRPVLENGAFEASYPSSHVFIGLVSLWTAFVFAKNHINNKHLKTTLYIALSVVALLLVITRVLSGKHWLTDIVGALLLSGFLISLEVFLEQFLFEKNKQ